MNVYDFDETIYHGDSTRDFYLFCLKNYPKISKYLPMQGWYAIKFGLKIMPKTQFKEKFYSFLKGIPDVDAAVKKLLCLLTWWAFYFTSFFLFLSSFMAILVLFSRRKVCGRFRSVNVSYFTILSRKSCLFNGENGANAGAPKESADNR